MKCELTTTKKAWKNPLAPYARCTKEAKFEFTARSGKKYQVCGIHAKKEQKWNKDLVLTPIQIPTP